MCSHDYNGLLNVCDNLFNYCQQTVVRLFASPPSSSSPPFSPPRTFSAHFHVVKLTRSPSEQPFFYFMSSVQTFRQHRHEAPSAFIYRISVTNKTCEDMGVFEGTSQSEAYSGHKRKELTVNMLLWIEKPGATSNSPQVTMFFFRRWETPWGRLLTVTSKHFLVSRIQNPQNLCCSV